MKYRILFLLATLAAPLQVHAGAAGIFGAEEVIIPGDEFWAGGAMESTLLSFDWNDIQPNPPTAVPGTLHHKDNFDFNGPGVAAGAAISAAASGSFDARLWKIAQGGLKSFGVLAYHGHAAPYWIYGGQIKTGIAYGDFDCPTRNETTGAITNWMDIKPASLEYPTYATGDNPLAVTGRLAIPDEYFNTELSPSRITSTGRNGVVPIIGCCIPKPGSTRDYVVGPYPDYLDGDYKAYWKAMMTAVVDRIRELQAEGQPLHGITFTGFQTALGRSGDTRMTPLNNERFTYDGLNDGAVGTTRDYYPNRYMASSNPNKTTAEQLWVFWNWNATADLLDIRTTDPKGHILLNLPTPMETPGTRVDFWPGFTNSTYNTPTPDTKFIGLKLEYFAQGESPASQNDIARDTIVLMGSSGTPGLSPGAWTRGEHGEPFSSSKSSKLYVPDANWASDTLHDKEAFNDRIEQHLWMMLMWSLHGGNETPNFIKATWSALRSLHKGGTSNGDEILASLQFFNRVSGYKSPVVGANGVKQTSKASFAGASPYALIIFRDAPDLLDSHYVPLAGAPRTVARVNAFTSLLGPRGLRADKITLGCGTSAGCATGFAKIANEMERLSHLCFECYSGPYTMYMALNGLDEDGIGPSVNTKSWWDQGPIDQRYGMYAMGVADGKTSFSVDVMDDWIVEGQEIKVDVVYLDRDGDDWQLGWIDSGGTGRTKPVKEGTVTTGTGQWRGSWKTQSYTITGLDKGKTNDITLSKSAGNPLFHMVYLERGVIPDEPDPEPTPPTIASVTSSVADGTYAAGAVIPITVNFNEPVYTVGNVTVTLDIEDVERTCTFSIPVGAPVSSKSCNYTVQVDDYTPDLTTRSIGGTIKDVEGTSMVRFLPVIRLADERAIVVDATDKIQPAVTVTLDGTEVTAIVTDNRAILVSGVSIGGTSTAEVSGWSCTQTSAVRVDCSGTATKGGSLVVVAFDAKGNRKQRSLDIPETVVVVPPPTGISLMTASCGVRWTFSGSESAITGFEVKVNSRTPIFTSPSVRIARCDDLVPKTGSNTVTVRSYKGAKRSTPVSLTFTYPY